MSEIGAVIHLVVFLAKVVYWIVRGVYRLGLGVVQWVAARVRAARVEGPGASSTAPARMGPGPRASSPVSSPASARARAPDVDAAVVGRLAAGLQELATQARALAARCDRERLCAPLRPTLRDFVLPEVAKMLADVRRAQDDQDLGRVVSQGSYLFSLTQVLSGMADQRCDPSLDELIDDADALAAACYGPVVEYCRTNGVPLESDRAAAVFGGACSPSLARIDDPSGLAILQLPWKWLAELHRWPAIGHEVGHDFYSSVPGLDAELVRRAGLSEVAGSAQLIDGRYGVTMRDVRRIVARWREELVADAFGAMMLGPAYAVATAAIFANPDEPSEILEIDTDGDEYEVHPPGHVRLAAVCRLLAGMGHGAQAEGMERRWRLQHGDPNILLLPTAAGFLRVDDQPFIESAAAVMTALQREGFTTLRGIPLSSMPGFDFGPREHAASLRIRDAFLADARPRPADARLLIAGAVLAWAERPSDSVRLLRAARLAVGTLDLPVPAGAGPAATSRPPSTARDLVRDAVLLDVLLTPPRASLLRR